MRKNLTREKKLTSRSLLKEIFGSPSTCVTKEWGVKLLTRGNGLSFSRFGIVLSRSFPDAVIRNRSKRCVREFLREHYADLPVSFDLVFVLYPPPAGQSLSYPPLVKRLLSRLLVPSP